MNWYEFIATLAGNLSWPAVGLVALVVFAAPLRHAVGLIGEIGRSADGWYVKFRQALMSVAKNTATPEQRSLVEKYSVIYTGENANGSYSLYSGGMTVCRMRAVVDAGSTSKFLSFPASMNNEPLSLQVIGDLQAKVVLLSKNQATLKFEAVDVARTIDVIVTGV